MESGRKCEPVSHHAQCGILVFETNAGSNAAKAKTTSQFESADGVDDLNG